MVCPGNFVAQQGGLGAGKIVRLGNFVAQQGGVGAGKMVRLGNWAQEGWCA